MIGSALAARGAIGSVLATARRGVVVGTSILRGLFEDTVAAPIASYAMEIGTLTVTDSAGTKVTVGGGSLNFSSPTTNFVDPRAVSVETTPRYQGLVHRSIVTANMQWQGFTTTSGTSPDRAGTLVRAGSAFAHDDGLQVGVLETVTINQEYILTTIVWDAGSISFIEGGAFTTPKLLHVGARNTTTTFKHAFCAFTSALAGSWKELDVFRAGGVWGQVRGGLTFVQVETPANGETITAPSSDMFVEIRWTPASGETLDLMIRRVDDDNCWIVRASQSGGWVRLFEKTGGVETQRATSNRTIIAGNAMRLTARASVTRISATSDQFNHWSYASATFNQSSTGVKVTGLGTASDLIAYSLTPAAALPAENVPIDTYPVYIFTTGDSKTAANRYQPPMLDDLRGAFSRGYYMRIGATSGDIATQWNSRMAGYLTNVPQVCKYALVDIGVNDLLLGTSQATYEAQLGAGLDKIKAQWADIQVLLVAPYQVSSPTNTANMKTWIQNVIASRSWCTLSWDMDDVLVGHMADNVHPTDPVGYTIYGQKWAEVITGLGG